MSRGKRVLLSLIVVLATAELCWAWYLHGDRFVFWVKGHMVHPGDRRDEIDERIAWELFELRRVGRNYRYDEVAYLQGREDQEQELDWPESPRGKLTIRTNNLGFRDDEPTLPEKHGLRILVAGDSHVAGPIENRQCFTNLLEERLRAEPGKEQLEVLNAGVAFTGPYCYLGVLRKYLSLAPDVFVAVLHTGNDFMDDLKVRYYLDGWSPPKGDDEYCRTIDAADELGRAPVAQGLNQAFRWKHFPSEPSRALDVVIESFVRMRELCAANGIRFLVLVLPTKMDVEPEDDAATQAATRAALGLSVEETGVNRELGLRFLHAMEAAGIRCLDPFEEMRRAHHPLYWRQDYHLGEAGHALLAEVLARELAGQL